MNSTCSLHILKKGIEQKQKNISPFSKNPRKENQELNLRKGFKNILRTITYQRTR